ncbi:unnamed protein product [Rotaria sp. Silwood1]|nr:unnamed protein product [Rotaria sp. Silwood1]CAF1619092.1 unnamed protein product [Rotaria sp. Silwood1]
MKKDHKRKFIALIKKRKAYRRQLHKELYNTVQDKENDNQGNLDRRSMLVTECSKQRNYYNHLGNDENQQINQTSSVTNLNSFFQYKNQLTNQTVATTNPNSLFQYENQHINQTVAVTNSNLLFQYENQHI